MPRVRKTASTFWCPVCQKETECCIIDSRAIERGRRRMRHCTVCGERTPTIEIPRKPYSSRGPVVEDLLSLPTEDFVIVSGVIRRLMRRDN